MVLENMCFFLPSIESLVTELVLREIWKLYLEAIKRQGFCGYQASLCWFGLHPPSWSLLLQLSASLLGAEEIGVRTTLGFSREMCFRSLPNSLLPAPRKLH